MIADLIDHLSEIFEDLFSQWETWFFLLLIVFAGGFVWVSGISASIDIWAQIVQFFKLTWWLWIFIVLWPLFVSTWLYWRQALFKKGIEFVLLELKIPREIKKSPQAMEQVLTSLHSLRNAPGNPQEKYWDGEVTRWFSLEMVSFGGEIRFFIRVYAKQKNLVEAAFFSYYPDVEIVEVEDYVNKLPQTLNELYRRKMEIWGSEMLLTKEAAYPIKTYPYFESEVEEKQFDPVSVFLEVLGKIKPEEFVGIQILIAPAGSKWPEKWKKLLEKLQKPITVTLSEEEGQQTPVARTPGQLEVLKAVEKNFSKPAFDTLIRLIYLSPQNLFYDSYVQGGLIGAFNQYSALNLNSFQQNSGMNTKTGIWKKPHIFPQTRNIYRKQRLLYLYLQREIPPETFMGRVITSYLYNWNFASRRFLLNTEGVATLFHPPTALVLTAPHIRRLESRKTGPPAGLAIYGEEEEIEKYQ